MFVRPFLQRCRAYGAAVDSRLITPPIAVKLALTRFAVKEISAQPRCQKCDWPPQKFSLKDRNQDGRIMPSDLSEKVWIENERGARLDVELRTEGGELLGTVFIDKMPYHVFFASRDELGRGDGKFLVDRDPDYQPTRSRAGRYLLIAPYGK